MITVRKSDERGHADHGWLNTYHTFSFADYYDPKQMGFRHLRVINEDWIAPGRGFGMHPHKNMEIVTFVVSGAIGHEDSMGNRSVLRAGEVQRMTAGSGVFHSEVNPSDSETVHLLQIWILPERRGLTPGYEQRSFRNGKGATLLVSPNGTDGSLSIHQNVEIYRVALEPGESWEFSPGADSGGDDSSVWVQVIHGSAELNGQKLNRGDGAAIEGERTLRLTAGDATTTSSGGNEQDATTELLVFAMRGGFAMRG